MLHHGPSTKSDWETYGFLTLGTASLLSIARNYIETKQHTIQEFEHKSQDGRSARSLLRAVADCLRKRVSPCFSILTGWSSMLTWTAC